MPRRIRSKIRKVSGKINVVKRKVFQRPAPKKYRQLLEGK